MANTDKELYNLYQNKIMDYDLFKSMTDKKLKTRLFQGWIAQFGGKAIREAMGITYAVWDYNNRTYGKAAKEQEPEKKTNTQPDRIDITDNYIDAEYTVVSEPKQREIKHAPLAGGSLAIAHVEPAQQQPEKKSFVSVEWTNTPEVIKSQMEALAAMLKFEKDEITVKLEVFK